MNSLFESLDEDAAQEEQLLPRSKSAKSDKEQTSTRSTGKDFSSDLQSFLQEAFDESLEKQLAERQDKPSPRPKNTRVKKRSRRPMGGLDSLIRSTVDMEPEESRPRRNVRRVTLTFDPDKLEKLKNIARNQRTYLRDVIDQIVADYLDRYEGGKEG
jgi:hypothetical protein